MFASANYSIITDFGCPFMCAFCITNSQNSKKKFTFNEEVFSDISESLSKGSYRRISVSGGGEPLFVHNNEIQAFYDRLFKFGKEKNIPIHVHTNIVAPNALARKFDKVTISINEENFLKKYFLWEDVKDKRFVHVSDGSDVTLIKEMIFNLDKDSQLTIKQMDGVDASCFVDVIKECTLDQRVMFLAEGDYNLYYVLNERKEFHKFKDISF